MEAIQWIAINNIQSLTSSEQDSESLGQVYKNDKTPNFYGNSEWAIKLTFISFLFFSFSFSDKNVFRHTTGLRGTR